MGFIPQALHEIKNRVVHAQGHHGQAGTMKFFFARITINAFGDAEHGDIIDAKVGHDTRYGAYLPCPAVDQQEVRPSVGFAIGVFFQQAFKAARQHLFHHAEIV